MFRERYVVAFHGMGYQIKNVLKENDIIAPEGFFEKDSFEECFMVVDDKPKDRVGVWFADIGEDMYIGLDGRLVEDAPDKFYVDREDVTIWG